MNKQIKFERTTNFTGRNGYLKCGGIDVQTLRHNRSVMLTAITSKDKIGSGDIEIPEENIPELIIALQAALDATS